MRATKYFLLIFLVVLLTSCQPVGQIIKINYNSNNGENNIFEYINSNSLSLKEPKKEGYRFLGWYLDEGTWEVPASEISHFAKMKIKEFNVYAKWEIITYQIKLDGISELPNTFLVKFGASIPNIPTPTKKGFSFLGWYLDSKFTKPFNLNSMPSSNLVLYPKWRDNNLPPPTEATVPPTTSVPPTGDKVNTEILYILGFYYGNSNGNLNNEGLATFNHHDELHYYIQNSSIYSFNPATNQTELVFEKTDGITPAFLNVYSDQLFFINKQNGNILVYDLEDQTTSVVSDKEYHYLRVDNYYIYGLFDDVVNGVLKPVYHCFRLKDYSLIREDLSGFEQINIISNRVLFKYYHDLTLNLMNYNGQGKIGIGNFNETQVQTIYESLVFYENNGHYRYVLSLEVNNQNGLYLYDSNSEELELIAKGTFYNLNFNDKSIFGITGNTLYEIDIETKVLVRYYELPVNSTNLQVINNWLYIGSYNHGYLMRINPTTYELEDV